MLTNSPCQCERDVNDEEIFDPVDEEELDEPLADWNAVIHRAMDVAELIPDVVAENEPEEEFNPINSIQENEIAGVPEPDEPETGPATCTATQKTDAH